METKHKKKKIIIGISNLWLGGAQKQLLRLLPYLRDNYDIEVVTLMSKDCMDNLYDDVTRLVPVHEFAFRGFFDIRSYRALKKKMKELNPNLVVSSLFFANVIFRALQPSLGYPIISREHNTYTNRTKFERLVDRILARRTEKIVAVSEEVAEYESQHSKIPREKFVVIENGIDLKEIDESRAACSKEDVRAELGIAQDALLFIYVGRLVIQKNVDVIIKGFAKFHRDNPKSVLLMVGDSIIIDDLKTLAEEEGVGSAVMFLGHQDNPHQYYVAADVFVSASEREGMSNTQLEALAHGLPLLTTKTGGTSALLREGENGFLIKEATPKGVASGMQKTHEADRAHLSSNSKNLAQNFDIKKTARSYESLFESVIR